MKTIQTDVAIIGTGTAGMTAYRAAARTGQKVLLINGGPYGTTCARVGCMPSKLLIAAADAAHAVRTTRDFGVYVNGDVEIDGVAVMDRVRRERDRFVGFVLEDVEGFPETDRLVGYARFTGPNTLQVEDHTQIQFKSAVIATGSAPYIPESFKTLGDLAIVNDDVFDWQDLPESVVVFGPGVIGLELGQALSRLGVRVRVFGVSGSLAGLTDPVVREEAKTIFQKDFYLDTKAEILETSRVDDQVRVRYVNLDGQEVTESFDYALMATGRRPNLAVLDLSKAGIEVDESGLPSFNTQTMQIEDKPVFIAGDVNGYLPLLHEAADEGSIAGLNAAKYPDVQPGLRRAHLGIIFTDPQITTVGQGPHELVEGQYVTGSVSFSNQGRSRVMLKNRGVLHLYAEKQTGRFLGAQMVGPSAEHLGHLLSWAVQQNMTISQMLQMPFYHPVIEEGLRTALRQTSAALKKAD
ncbi:dihydrolipoyl dehydrogenase [Orrella sp. 11846]|uniref:dihydrolipoyl dehydrogenase n=1 Tax=Orrella sp. 11846 TaxID=3409913 RepID=UPI003B5BF66C